MSYFANLVGRTLGITPVAQPVIQAKFASQGYLAATPGQDAIAPQIAAPVARARPSNPKQESQVAKPQPTLAAMPEASGTRQNRGPIDAQQQVRTEPSEERAIANVQTDSVAESARQPTVSRLALSFAPDRLTEVQPPNALDGTLSPTPAEQDFRLMQSAPAAPQVTNFRPLSAASVTSLRPMALDSAQRPVVRVHIGRVDVRMVTSTAKESRTATPTVAEAKPASLDEYLRARQRGRQ